MVVPLPKLKKFETKVDSEEEKIADLFSQESESHRLKSSVGF
jgi:hypothetical protein